MKLAYRAAMVSVLIVLAIGTVYIGYQLKRMNDHVEFIREQIPMSMLGN